MEKDALVLIFERNAFYRRLHFLTLGSFLLSVVMIVILLYFVDYLFKHPTHPLYFASDNVGRLQKVIPVGAPNMKTDDVVKWANEAIEEAYTYDYVNYRAQLQDAQKYFTDYGWNKYMTALGASNNLIGLVQRKLVQSATVVGPPAKITEGRFRSGPYAWKFEDIPVLVTYQEPPYDDKSTYSNPLKVTVLIERQPELEGYNGLGILQLIAELVTAGPAQPTQMPSG